jgi:hypothetical protein
MTVGELKELLEGLEDNMEVQLQTQKSWPFINDIHGLKLKSDVEPEDGDEDEDMAEEVGEQEPDVLYIVEGEQLGYGDKGAWH